MGSYHIVALPSLRNFSSTAVKAQSQVHLFRVIKRELTQHLKALMTLFGSYSPLDIPCSKGSWEVECSAGRLSVLMQQGEKGL